MNVLHLDGMKKCVIKQFPEATCKIIEKIVSSRQKGEHV
jgi:radical SAM superfamily enzyme with C-terminal helix-hairpin-helix motif